MNICTRETTEQNEKNQWIKFIQGHKQQKQKKNQLRFFLFAMLFSCLECGRGTFPSYKLGVVVAVVFIGDKKEFLFYIPIESLPNVSFIRSSLVTSIGNESSPKNFISSPVR